MEAETKARQRMDRLTALETAYLRAVLAGEGPPSTAQKLGLNQENGQLVRHAMMVKLGANTTADAVRIGIRAGLS